MKDQSPSRIQFPQTLKLGSIRAKIYRQAREKNGADYVSFILATTEGGKRRLQTFADYSEARAEADRELARMARGESAAQHLSPADRASFAACLEALRPTGTPILEAVKSYASAQAKLAGRATIAEAVEHWLRTFAETKDTPLPEAVAQFLAEKREDGASAMYLKDLASRLGIFAEAHPGHHVRQFTGEQLDAWMRARKMSPRSRLNYSRVLSTFFTWCRRKRLLPKDRITEAADLPRPKIVTEEIAFYSADELRILLSRCGPELLPYVAIGAFAGLRGFEILRLDWSAVNFTEGHILVNAAASKVNVRRLVPIHPTLAAWLTPYRNATGPVCGTRRPDLLLPRRCMRGAKDEHGNPLPVLKRFVRNGLRHSCATYAIALRKDLPAVALELGNSPSILLRHYRGLTTEREAREWFNVLPEPSASKVVRFPSTGTA